MAGHPDRIIRATICYPTMPCGFSPSSSCPLGALAKTKTRRDGSSRQIYSCCFPQPFVATPRRLFSWHVSQSAAQRGAAPTRTVHRKNARRETALTWSSESQWKLRRVTSVFKGRRPPFFTEKKQWKMLHATSVFMVGKIGFHFCGGARCPRRTSVESSASPQNFCGMRFLPQNSVEGAVSPHNSVGSATLRRNSVGNAAIHIISVANATCQRNYVASASQRFQRNPMANA